MDCEFTVNGYCRRLEFQVNQEKEENKSLNLFPYFLFNKAHTLLAKVTSTSDTDCEGVGKALQDWAMTLCV